MKSDSPQCDSTGDCRARPCGCSLAIVTGCTCGLYLDQIRRNLGHHTKECGIFKKARSA